MNRDESLLPIQLRQHPGQPKPRLHDSLPRNLLRTKRNGDFMKATRQEIKLLDGFLDELDWFIGESKRNKALCKVRDLIVEIVENNGWNGERDSNRE